MESKVLDFLIEHYRELCSKNSKNATDFSQGRRFDLKIMKPVSMHEVLQGTRFYNEKVNLDSWLAESHRYKGEPGTQFERYSRVAFIFKIGAEHAVLAEIRTRKRAVGYYSRMSTDPRVNEIVLYDSNHREFRHMHNSVFLVLRRFILLEIMESSQVPQGVAYQKSLEYQFRRAVVPQEVVPLMSRQPNPDSHYYFLRYLECFVND